MTAHDPAGRIAAASAVRPTAQQIAWQRLEFYAFIHFGMNTMTDREWGHGHEDPALFDPDDVDADQWVRALESAGMTAVILTAKHHDGFCLWPSGQTSHSVRSSPWRSGHGDLVAEVARACAARGLKFGVYLSPWDRTEPSYGSGAAYDDLFVAQLTELLTGYGPIFCVWFDGANGEGPDGRRQVYDWARYYEVVRRLQPAAVISVCGPDVRWCGNEAGHTRTDEWSVVPASLQDVERTASLSQQFDDGRFSRQARTDDDDLGSREVLFASDEPLAWYPAEVNTSIRPGWFHHPAEDDAVRSAEELFDIYRRSVGGNSTFLLNVPPDRHGRIAEPDAAALAALGDLVRGIAARDVVPEGRVDYSSGSTLPAGAQERAVWLPAANDSAPTATVHWDEPVRIDTVVLGEWIERGQQIEDAVIRATNADRELIELGRVRSVGYLRIVDLAPVVVRSVSVEIRSARGPVAIEALQVLAALDPPHRRESAPGPERSLA